MTEPAGERKQATVLFADIVGSTAMIAELDAEGAASRLQPVVLAMTRAVRRFDGTVLRSLGDGIKAAFGVPLAREGHALLACQAALAMRAAVAALPNGPPIRIGFHAGEVVSGTLDTGSAIEQEAQGLTVHLAARIEQAADPGEIFLSRAARTLVSAYCVTQSMGARDLKGIPGPTELYRLIGMKPAVNSEQFRGSARVPLRGRDQESGILQNALLETGPGSIRIVGVSGPPGVGKSRLCFEFGEWCRARQIEVVEARGHIYGQATPLQPILELLRVVCRITPMMDPEDARERIGQTLIALDPALSVEMPLLADFLGVAEPDETARRVDPRTRNARLREVIGRMIKTSGRKTSVLIIEDLHWLDEESRQFLETFVEAVEGTQILMVLTFRPGWSAGWPAPSYYHEIDLTELGLNDVRRVIADLTGPAEGLDQVVTHIAERSAGNPFFAEELILSLAQSGVLLGEKGRYRLGPQGWSDPVLPATVEAVIQARIDMLPDMEKSLLRIGAVVGKEFPVQVVREVSGFADQAVRSFLDRLRRAELIQPRDTAMGESFAFRHPLIQEVCYAMQLRARRVPLHAAVAKAIETQDWGQRDEFAGLVAHHYESAGQNLQAAMCLQRGARWIGRTNSRRALTDWKKIRNMMRDQPASKENDELRALTGGQLLTFGWREGMAPEEAKIYCDEAVHYARAAGNRKHEALLIAGFGRISATSGPADVYVSTIREALALTDAESNPEGHLLLNGLLCQAYSYAGLVADALAANDLALAAVDMDGAPHPNVVLGLTVSQMVGFDVAHWIRCLRPRLLIALGRFDEADQWLSRVFQVDPDRMEPFHQFIPHIAAVELAAHREQPGVAKRHAEEAAGFGNKSDMSFIRVTVLLGHGIAALAAENHAAARAHFQSAMEAARTGGAGMEIEARLMAHLAETELRSGDPARAVRSARDAIAAAVRRNDRLAECHASLIAALAFPASGIAHWKAEATELLDRGERLIVMTGARIYHPMLQQAKLLIDNAERK